MPELLENAQASRGADQRGCARAHRAAVGTVGARACRCQVARARRRRRVVARHAARAGAACRAQAADHAPAAAQQGDLQRGGRARLRAADGATRAWPRGCATSSWPGCPRASTSRCCRRWRAPWACPRARYRAPHGRSQRRSHLRALNERSLAQLKLLAIYLSTASSWTRITSWVPSAWTKPATSTCSAWLPPRVPAIGGTSPRTSGRSA